MSKKNKLVAKYQECPNCGFPFQGHETFCPNCGQKNQLKALSFKNFMNEVFQGFTSWDAKFWRTLYPLLIKPGKVSKDYIEGKRVRYTNPFRFYITTSIVFFLIIGLSEKIDGINQLDKVAQEIKKENNDKELTPQQIDSIKAVINKSMSSPFIPKEAKNRVLDEIEKNKTIKKKKYNVTFGGGTRLDRFKILNDKYPQLSIDQGLDSLGYQKTFMNRFLYDRGVTLNKISQDKESFFRFLKATISYGASALFVLLPLFTMFLAFLYMRRKYTYVEHLIFVFHTQTVFFILLGIYFVLSFFITDAKFWVFILLFLIYLFLAMKRFYKQGSFKTFIKFLILNSVYFMLAVLGVVLIMFLSLSFY